MRMVKTLIIVVSLLFAWQVFADTSSPAMVLNKVAQSAITALKKEKAKLPAGKKIAVSSVHKIIEKLLLSHVDLDAMSRAVLGRNAWGVATTSQRKKFIGQFTNLVINTYASALVAFNESHVQFYRIRGGYQGKSIVQVNSTINNPGVKPLSVIYHLEKKNNQWLIFDFSVDGISLVESYKAQFSSIMQQKGVDGLIQALASQNEALNKQQRGK